MELSDENIQEKELVATVEIKPQSSKHKSGRLSEELNTGEAGNSEQI